MVVVVVVVVVVEVEVEVEAGIASGIDKKKKAKTRTLPQDGSFLLHWRSRRVLTAISQTLLLQAAAWAIVLCGCARDASKRLGGTRFMMHMII